MKNKSMKKSSIVKIAAAFFALAILAGAVSCGPQGQEEQSSTIALQTTQTPPESSADAFTDTQTEDTQLLINPGELFISDELTPELEINKTMQSLIYLESPADFGVKDTSVSVKVEENGVRMNDPSAAEANLAAINALIAKAEPGTAILFPEGKLYIAPSAMGGIMVFAKKDIVLHGENTLLVDTAFRPQATDAESYPKSNIFCVYQSERITVEGFGIEYLAQTSADGTVISVSGGYTYIEMDPEAFSADFPVEKLPLSGDEVCYCLTLYDGKGVSGTEYYLGKDPVFRLEKAEGLTGHSYDPARLYRIKGEYGKKGDVFACRFSSGTYSTSSMMFYQSTELILRDVTVRSAPAQIAHFGLGCADIWIDRLSVKPWDGVTRYFTTNIDTLYFSGVRGRLEVTDCDFEGLGDDALNVHSRLMSVSGTDGNAVSLSDSSGSSAYDPLWASVGDTLRFFGSDCRVLGDAKVVSCSNSGVTVDALPAGVGKGCTVQNRELNPITRILRCKVSRGRARAFLIQTANALIDSCDISLTRLPGIIVSPDFDRWFEAGFTDNVLIRGCTFTDCCGFGGNGVITVSGCHDGNPIPAAGITGHKNITVTQCEFVFSKGHRKAAETEIRACDNAIVKKK